MKGKEAGFFEKICFAVGLFLVSYIIVRELFDRLQVTMNPTIFVVVGVSLFCGGIVIKLFRKRSK